MLECRDGWCQYKNMISPWNIAKLMKTKLLIHLANMLTLQETFTSKNMEVKTLVVQYQLPNELKNTLKNINIEQRNDKFH